LTLNIQPFQPLRKVDPNIVYYTFNIPLRKV
jgi:hypothetical protein